MREFDNIQPIKFIGIIKEPTQEFLDGSADYKFEVKVTEISNIF